MPPHHQTRHARGAALTTPEDWLHDEPVGRDWLADWASLPSRSRTVLLRRAEGQTLDRIGQELTPAVTRERVRQIETEAKARLKADQEWEAPDLANQLAEEIDSRLVISVDHARQLTGTRSEDGCRALLLALGYRPADLLPRGQWWSTEPDRLSQRLRPLTALMPLTHDETFDAAQRLAIPAELAWLDRLDEIDTSIAQHQLGWIRRTRRARDIAYLWLREQGEPRSPAEIAVAAGCSEPSVREIMRRDPGFAQVRPEGTWALSDWATPGTGEKYASAVDVVVEVLTELGAMTSDQLRIETQRRYPVSNWRVQQCLSSNHIGILPDGRFDLVERRGGACRGRGATTTRQHQGRRRRHRYHPPGQP